MSDNDVADYGWTALPADLSTDQPVTSNPAPVNVASLNPPTTPLSLRIAAYAKSKLSPETYRHSHRVYSYGRAIASQCFPSWNLTPGSKLDETWYLTAMLHDIGTADEFIHSTRLSFEFWGGYHALDILQHPSSSNSAPQTGDHSSTSAPRSQAESVAEAIIRHQDIQPAGYVSLMTRLIHLGTLMDNVGASTDLVNPKTIENVVQEYDRKGWSGCFESTLKKEKSIKPYTMVSRIEGFEGKISAHGAKMGD